MADPRYSSNVPPGSSSNKRSYDAMGPEAETDQSDSQRAGRSHRDSPARSSSSAEGSRERNKRARNDSDSSYTSELDDILLPANEPVSPSASSGSSQSSYRSAQTSFPPHASPSGLEPIDEAMLVDPVLPETRATSPAARSPAHIEHMLPLPPRLSPLPSGSAAIPRQVPSDTAEEFARSFERANAFDRELAPLRSSPAVLPTSASRSAGPLPPVQLPPGLDDDLPPLVPNEHVLPVDQDEDLAWLEAFAHGPSPTTGHRHDDPTSARNASDDADRRGVSSPRRAGNADVPNRARSPTDRLMDAYNLASATLRDSWSRHARDLARARQRLSDILPRPPLPPLPPAPDALGRRGFGTWSSARSGPRPDFVSQDEHIFENERQDRPSRRSSPPRFSAGLDLYRNTTTRDRSSDHSPSVRSPRNATSLPSSHLPEMSEGRSSVGSTIRYSLGSPSFDMDETVYDPIPSPRLSAAAVPGVLSSSRDRWARAHEQRMNDVDRMLREAEEQRRRIAEFVAAPLPPLPTDPADGTDLDFSIPTSSYSTLRHALDDSTAGAAARREHLHPSAEEPARLSNRFRDARSDDRDNRPWGTNVRHPLEATSGDLLGWDWSDMVPYPYADDFGLPTRRRGPFRARTAEEGDAAGTNSNQPSPRREPRLPPPRPVDDELLGSTGSYLEANSAARSIGLSGLRHRARARSPPPAIPPPPVARADYTVFHDFTWTRGEEPAFSSISTVNRPYYPPRSAADDAMLQSFMDSPAPARRPSPERSTSSGNAARPAEERSRTSRYGNINLDAYRDGPFRATLARSVALQQRTAPEVRREQAEPRPTSRPLSTSFAWLMPEDEDRLTSLERRHDASAARREREAPRPWARLRDEVPETRSDAGPARTRSPPAVEAPRSHPFSDLFWPPSDYDPFAASQQPPVIPPRPGFRPADPRSSAVREPERSSLRHRTLLEREHASSAARGETRASESMSARLAARMERLERAGRSHEMARLMAARTQAAARPPPAPRPAARSQPTMGHQHQPLDDQSTTTPAQPFVWTRRYARHTAPSANLREGRAEDRQAPLNGRFARRSGLGHFPPDIVWVDLPPTGRAPHFSRRRNFGDYVRDEDFDVSYEGLLSLSSLLGDAKPRGTPDDIITSLPRGTYSEWAHPGATEERCPICLDDYQSTDPCLRIPGCTHWFHEGCLQQWLKGARTCPVCRGRVSKPRSEEPSAPVAGPSGSNNRNRDDDSDNDERDDPGRMRVVWNPFRPPWRHD